MALQRFLYMLLNARRIELTLPPGGRSSITTGRALAGSLMAASLLALGACAERDDGTATDAASTPAATTPSMPAGRQAAPDEDAAAAGGQ